MRNLNMTAVKSQAIGRGNKRKLSIYYSIVENAVYTTGGAGRYYVTDLIRPNTADEIETTVKRWLAM